jgi:hypothetical protein
VRRAPGANHRDRHRNALQRAGALARACIAGVAAGMAGLASAPAAADPAALQFVAMGDMPYGSDAATGGAYRALLARINELQPPLVLHVGDFKDGVTACPDALYERQHAYFQRLESAVLFTPGDNDWYDCQRTGEDPLERLEALRERFFGAPRALGLRPVPLERQSDPMADHVAHYPRQRENLRLWLGDVLVATFHTVGPYNGADAATPALRDEHRVREAANAAWLRATFELARQRGARALVLATQGDPLTRERRSDPWRVRRGFEGSIERTLVPLARAHRLPVLLVHGDSHHFRFDQPFTEPDGQPVGRLWRLQVFGDPQMHAVRVTIRPAQAPQPFDATPIWNPLSPDPRR